jgi:tripartite-type tricarboxylate transporter receptor subunit TctC
MPVFLDDSLRLRRRLRKINIDPEEDKMPNQIRALAFVALLTLPSVAYATDWPARQVRIIAPSTPGGAADTFARLLADNLPSVIGGRFFVDNRPGAGGMIGAAACANAEPDGATFVTSSSAYHAIAPAVSANPLYDPMKNFTHVAYIGGPPNVFVVHPSLGVRSLPELIARAKTEIIGYVSPGLGTLGHLTAERFAEAANIKLQHIPHKGASQAMIDLVAGTVKLGTMTWTSALGQIRAGTVIPIAVTSSKRLPEFPDLPTFAELGYDSLTAVSWFALSGPAGLPDEITRKMNAAVIKVLEMPAVREKLERDAIETRAMSAAEFTRFMQGEIDKWAPIAKRIGQ